MICPTCTPVFTCPVPPDILSCITPLDMEAFHGVCCCSSRDDVLLARMNKVVARIRDQMAGAKGEMLQVISQFPSPQTYRFRDTLPKIDLAIALEGPLVEALLPLTLETMRMLNLLDGVTIHFVDKGVSDAVKDYASRWGRVYDMPDQRCFSYARSPLDVASTHKDVVGDVCATMEWMVKNCGVEPWIFIMHFDIEFVGPWLDHYRSLIDPTVGQIGDHAGGLVGYSRKALSMMELSFWHMSSIYLVRDHNGDLKARHANDARCTNKDIPVHGFDVGELLELYLQHYDWKVLVDTDVQQQRYRIHSGSGGGRCGDAVNQMIFERTLTSLHRYGLKSV